MLHRTLAVARAPGLRAIQTVCSPLTGREEGPPLLRHPPTSLFDRRLTIGGSFFNVSNCPKLIQVRWRADNRGGSGRGGGGGRGRRRSGPDFRKCQNVVEIASLAHCSLDAMSNRDIATFWSALPRLLHKPSAQDPNLEGKLRSVIDATNKRMNSFQYRDLAQTSMGIAKTAKQVSQDSRRYRGNDPRQILRGLLLSESQYVLIFDIIASLAVGKLNRFDARHLSNLIYSYGLVEYNPDIGGESLFDVFAQAAVKNLHTFNSQDISNMLLAFVYVDAKNSRLFQETGEMISGMDLRDFTSQAQANVLWSFAKSGETNPEVFRVLGDHIVAMSLVDFRPQHMSNIVWAYATAGVAHTALFKKIGDHFAVFDKDKLDYFKPQDFSNTLWAFATAEVSHHELFKKFGHHIAKFGGLDSFNSQTLSNTAWAYATARLFDRRLFEKLVTEAIVMKDCFNERAIANFLLACATVGYTDERLFLTFAPVIASKLDECNDQDLANTAWAYSVANVPSQDLLNGDFIRACASKEESFCDEGLAQLHQWQLWQQELKSGIELPKSLQGKIHNAFISTSYYESKMQDDVVGELKAVGLDLEEEVLLGSGYRIDAVVEVGDGRRVAVEVDGPTHFIQRLPTGSTTLKHRQVTIVDCVEVVSVPYWEWDELKNSLKKQHYLRTKLGCETA